MDVSKLSAAKKAVGLNQTKRAVKDGSAKKIFAAKDADEQFLLQIKKMCEGFAVDIDGSMTKKELGDACEIKVGCAVCALVD
ncbi:MAG: ribosomal L7Ae/L30e/S12e/Gadd45 family protein [Oscillospiraceae bacterium]|nr:ribosomal L7Ae/L30e/S12e/Gadd45 family protein [Oscillospiraceae bacterium]